MNVYAFFCQDFCNHRNHTWNILMRNYQCIRFPVNGNCGTVDFIDDNVTAANRSTLYLRSSACRIFQCDFCCIGVSTIDICFFKFECQTFFFCHIHADTNAGIICIHSQNTCNDSFICTVAFICFRKGTTETDMCFHRCSTQDGSCILTNAHSTGCMGTGRADHDRADNVKCL